MRSSFTRDASGIAVNRTTPIRSNYQLFFVLFMNHFRINTNSAKVYYAVSKGSLSLSPSPLPVRVYLKQLLTSQPRYSPHGRIVDELVFRLHPRLYVSIHDICFSCKTFHSSCIVILLHMLEVPIYES